MPALDTFFAVGWALFWAFWLVAALASKRGHGAWSHGLRARVVVAVLVVVLVRFGTFRDSTADVGPLLAGLGVILFAIGLAFAIWARVHLGRNWGSPMTTKDEPELITSGPYRRVRHPIYTGIIVAGAGTALALSWPWLAVVGMVGGYFVYAATVEERHLLQEFPDTYPEYRRSTKMLLPFVF